MKNLIVTTPFLKEAQEMRKAIVENLIDLMKEHNVTEVYCSEISQDNPIVNRDINGEIATLESIVLVTLAEREYLIFNCESIHYLAEMASSNIDIELLVSIYNWIMDYEDDLFEPITKTGE